MRKSAAVLIVVAAAAVGLAGCSDAVDLPSATPSATSPVSASLDAVGTVTTSEELSARLGEAMSEIKTMQILQVSKPQDATDDSSTTQRQSILDVRDAETPKVQMSGAQGENLEAVVYIGDVMYYSTDGTWEAYESQFPFTTAFDEAYWSSVIAASGDWTAVNSDDDDGVQVMHYQATSVTAITAEDGVVATDLWIDAAGVCHGIDFYHVQDGVLMNEQVWYSEFNADVDIKAPGS